jgi:hypothetical protein
MPWRVTLSNIVNEYSAVVSAFDKPLLELLNAKYSRVTLAVLRVLFSGDGDSVSTNSAHVRVDGLLAELALRGVDVPSDNTGQQRTGRSLCREWVKRSWLVRSDDPHDGEIYSLSSFSLEALRIVADLDRSRAVISESRLSLLFDAIRQLATNANPDRSARVKHARERVRHWQNELARLSNKKIPLDTPDAHAMYDGFNNIAELLQGLEVEFRRLEEKIDVIHRQLLDDFRNDDRSTKEIIKEYLTRVDRLMEDTPEGRAFMGAFEVLRNSTLLAQVGRDTEVILEHPFADEFLDVTDKREFRNAVTLLESGSDGVITCRTRAHQTMKDYILSSDRDTDREVDVVLREIMSHIPTYLEETGPRAKVPVEVLPAQLDMKMQPARLHNFADDAPPPPLANTTSDEVSEEALTVEQLRAMGGPRLEEYRSLLDAVTGSEVTLAELFASQSEELRRPVELAGLLHLVSSSGVDVTAALETEVVDTAPPGQPARRYRVPRVPLTVPVEEE